jgi:peptide deformylase
MILPIARMGHPILKQRAAEVSDINNSAVQEMIQNLLATFRDSGGVGLAAPQILAPVRIVVFCLSAELGSKRGFPEGIPETVLINPIIEPLSETLVAGWEGCLSLPGLMGKVSRYQAIRYSGITPTGEAIMREVEGYHARVVQHECDHLDGILYPARILDYQDFGFVEEVQASLVVA